MQFFQHLQYLYFHLFRLISKGHFPLLLLNIYCLWYIHFLFPKVIDHNPVSIVNYNESLNIQLFTDFSSEDITKAELYLKSDNDNFICDTFHSLSF